MCFIDYEKAFDRVQHAKMLQHLKNIGLDQRDIRIIANLYWGQRASVQIENQSTEEMEIRRGVRQGCVLSPLLFNIYSEFIISEALVDSERGISVNGVPISNIRYADDTVLLGESAEDLQWLLNKINEVSNENGLKMNVNKTKWMVISKQNVVDIQITLGSQTIERVERYNYLGCGLNVDWNIGQEVSSRIERARNAFTKMKQLLTSRQLSLNLRLRLVKCYVFPVLLYGMEGWTLLDQHCKKIEAFEMWIYRRMLRIAWTDRIRNTEVLLRLNATTEVINTIKRRKLEYFGHVMRGQGYRLLQLIIQGRIVGRRLPGRRRTSWLKNLREWYGKSTKSLFRAAVSKIQIARMIANLQ